MPRWLIKLKDGQFILTVSGWPDMHLSGIYIRCVQLQLERVQGAVECNRMQVSREHLKKLLA